MEIKFIEPNANALKSLFLLRDSNPVLSQKWTSNSSGSGNTSTTTAIDWTVLPLKFIYFAKWVDCRRGHGRGYGFDSWY